MAEHKNLLEQKDKFRWRDNPPTNITRDDMAIAFELAGDTETQKCTCWNTSCVYYDNCKACIVFHMSLDQFTTCQREKLEAWGVDYIGHTTSPRTDI